jgi:hypothetical protein
MTRRNCSYHLPLLPILMVGLVVEPVLMQRKPFLARPLLRQNPRAVLGPSA